MPIDNINSHENKIDSTQNQNKNVLSVGKIPVNNNITSKIPNQTYIMKKII